MWEPGQFIIPCGVLGLGVSLGVSRAIVQSSARSHALKSSVSLGDSPPSQLKRETQFHHQHTSVAGNPIPRYGGVGILAAFLVVGAVAVWITGGLGLSLDTGLAVLISSLFIFAVGILDDFHPLGAKKKLICQILAAALAYFLGIQINTFKIPFTDQILELSFTASFIVTVFWMVALTNLVNLIDGIDGLAGGIGVLLMGLLAWSASAFNQQFYMLVSVGVLGGLLGFLRYNFPPAKIYLGDGGAYFLGFLIACLAIETSHKGTIVAALTAPLLALALPILDTTLAIVRRAIKGLPLFRPDMDHIHHKLMQQGVTRTRAVLTLYAFSAVALLFAFGVFMMKGEYLPVMLGVAGAALILILRQLKLIPHFRTAREVLRTSWRLRQHSKYALTMSDWLQMEAERGRSLAGLWKDYLFMIERLGLHGVKIAMPDQTLENNPETAVGRVWELTRPFSARSSTLTFFCLEGVFSLKEFEHLCDLSAEAWIKAMMKWEKHSSNATPSRATSLPTPSNNLTPSVPAVPSDSIATSTTQKP